MTAWLWRTALCFNLERLPNPFRHVNPSRRSSAIYSRSYTTPRDVTNDHPEPFVWTANSDKILATVKRGRKALEVDPLATDARRHCFGHHRFIFLKTAIDFGDHPGRTVSWSPFGAAAWQPMSLASRSLGRSRCPER